MRKTHSQVLELTPQQRLLLKLNHHSSAEGPEDPRLATSYVFQKTFTNENYPRLQLSENLSDPVSFKGGFMPKISGARSMKMVQDSRNKLFSSQESKMSLTPIMSMNEYKKMLRNQEYALDLVMPLESQTPKPTPIRGKGRAATPGSPNSFNFSSKIQLETKPKSKEKFAKGRLVPSFNEISPHLDTQISQFDGSKSPNKKKHLHLNVSTKESNEVTLNLSSIRRDETLEITQPSLNKKKNSTVKTQRIYRPKSLRNNDYIFGKLETETQEYFRSQNSASLNSLPSKRIPQSQLEHSPLKPKPSSPSIIIRKKIPRKTRYRNFSPKSPLPKKGSSSMYKRIGEQGLVLASTDQSELGPLNMSHEDRVQEAQTEIMGWKDQLDGYSKKFGAALKQLKVMKEKDMGRQEGPTEKSTKTSFSELKERFSFTIRLIIFKLKMMGLTYKEIVLHNVFASVPYEKPDSENFFKAVRAGDMEKVCYIVKFDRYIVFDYDITRKTAVHWAAKRNYPEILHYLLEKGADINAQDLVGKTPLIDAVREGNYQCVRILIIRGADPMALTSGRHNALYYCKDHRIGIILKRAMEFHSGMRMTVKMNQWVQYWQEKCMTLFDTQTKVGAIHFSEGKAKGDRSNESNFSIKY